MDMVNFINYDMGNVKIGDSIREALSDCSFGDSYIARTINVSRDTIRRWKTGLSTTARQQNLSFLAQELKLDLKIDSGVAEFKEINIEEIEMAEGITQDIIKNQLDHINTLKKDNERMQTLIDKQEIIISDLNELKDSINLPTIDHHELQIITNTDSFTYHSVSTAYAKLLGYTPIEMMSKDFNWKNIVHEDDYFKCSIIAKLKEQNGKAPSSQDYERPFNTWKLKKKDGGVVYVESYTVNVSDQFSYVQMNICKEKLYKTQLEEYLKNN